MTQQHNMKRTFASLFAALGALALTLSLPAQADGVDEPIPSFYQEAGLSPNRDYVNQHANESIDPFSGKLQWHFVDVFIPGNGGLDIKVQRSYSSLNELLPDDSPYGAGWTMHFGRVLRKQLMSLCDFSNFDARLNPVLELPDGSRQILYNAIEGGASISANLWRATCNNVSPGGLIIMSPDGTRYEMTTLGPAVGASPASRQSAWYTTRIVDRNGNTLNFTYGYLNLSTFGVQSVTSSDGRSLTFSYVNGALDRITDGSRTWSYVLSRIPNIGSYQYFLNEVRRPDGTVWKFDYNPSASGPGSGTPGGYSMRQITYPTGGTIAYTYGFVTFNVATFLPISTVVTQKQGDGGTWNYTYTPATTAITLVNGGFTYTIDSAAPNTEFDKTVVVGPDGSQFFLHVGYTSVSSGLVFYIGTLLGKISSTLYGSQIFESQIEAYGWTYALLSNQTNLRPGGAFVFDTLTYVPLLKSKGISRSGELYNTAYSNYDSYNNPQTITETGSDTRTTLLTYYANPAKWIIHQKKDETTDTIGAITRSFDANANLLSENRYGVPTTYTYTAQGDIATKTDARNNTTTYGSYFRGIPQIENQPEAVTVSRVVSGVGNILSQTDGETATTSYTYDGLNRLTGITHPLGNPVTVAWETSSVHSAPPVLTRTVVRGSYKEVVTYDAFGRESQIQHIDTGAGNDTITQTYRYDQIGRRIFSSYPNNPLGSGFVYDILGRPLAIYHVFDPVYGTSTSGRVFFYTNYTVELTNERNKVTTYAYRTYGDPGQRDLLSVTAPEPGASLALTRNGLGQMTQVVQDGKTRTFGYDSRYFLTSMTDPEIGATTYGRDAVGNMTSRQVATSGTTLFGNDGRNRVTTIAYPLGTPSVTKTYYKDDKLRSTDNGVARRDYVYDANKNLKQETLSLGAQSPFTMRYAYDNNDALDVLTYGSGKTLTYRPDAFGRPTKAAPYISAVAHHPNGQIASFTYANGTQASMGLNARLWPETLSIAGSANVANMAYTYDGIGNVTGIQDTVDPTNNRAMQYDGIDRLVTANGSWGNGAFTYDGRGNITKRTYGLATLNYDYDATTNRLTGTSGIKSYNFSYDVYGNVTGNGFNTFAYNDAANMRCANCGLANEVTYDYDAANTRVRSTKAGVPTYYVYGLNGSLLWEQTPGVSLKEYIYLGGKQVAVRHKDGG